MTDTPKMTAFHAGAKPDPTQDPALELARKISTWFNDPTHESNEWLAAEIRALCERECLKAFGAGRFNGYEKGQRQAYKDVLAITADVPVSSEFYDKLRTKLDKLNG